MDGILFVIFCIAICMPAIFFILFMILTVVYNKHIYKKNEEQNIKMCRRRMEQLNSMHK